MDFWEQVRAREAAAALAARQAKCLKCGGTFERQNRRQIHCLACRGALHREQARDRMRERLGVTPTQAMCPMCGNTFTKLHARYRLCPPCVADPVKREKFYAASKAAWAQRQREAR